MACSFVIGAIILCTQNQTQSLDSFVNLIVGFLRSARLSEQEINNRETKGSSCVHKIIMLHKFFQESITNMDLME